eukprot:3318581-Karenia_brevis.AAC.1
MEQTLVRRPDFPESPSGFVWCDQRTPRKTKATRDPLAAAPAEDNTNALGANEGPQQVAGFRKKTRTTKRRILVLSIAPAGTGFIKLE